MGLHFVFDGCANGQKLKCLTVVDEFSKESLCIEAAGSNLSQHLIAVLERFIDERGCPLVLRSDNGTKFVSLALMQCTAAKGLRNLLIEVRPHSSLGYKTPMEFMSQWKNKSTNGAGVST